MEEIIKRYDEYRSQLKAYELALFQIGWDSNTETPEGAFSFRSEYIGKLAEMSYSVSVSEGYTKTVEELCDNADKLDPVLSFEVKKIKKQMDKYKKIPKDEYTDYQTLLAQSQQIWAKAKENNDWEAFKPTLAKIIEYQRKYVKYLETPELAGYDVLLDEYELGSTRVEYDKFFDALKKDLVPFVRKVLKKKAEKFEFAELSYPIEKQKKISEYMQGVMCFDKTRGVMKESAHPFCSNNGSRDVRFTTKYHEDNFISSIYSSIHEMGHALYELNIDPALDRTMVGGGASLGIHESQSRFYENIIGRSMEFWEVHFKHIKRAFPKQLAGVTAKDMYRYVNSANASYIRIEADELTYPLHIMLRYDIEREIMEGKLTVDELPERWNRLVSEYFGLPAPDYKNGVMQDVHWSIGYIGYFPTYALGSALASQIFHHMQKDFDVLDSLKCGNVSKINEWMKERLHKYGSSKTPKELVKIVTGGEAFNPDYYVKYLIEKYGKIYDMK